MSIAKRKQAHVDLCLLPESQVTPEQELFADIQLPYRALPELNLEDVSLETKLLAKTLQQPLIIASMTGGVAHAQTINTHLAQAAEACGVAMGVGSQRIALELADARDTFQLVRKHAPTTFVFANMGAVQLNYGRTISDYQAVVDMIQADALYLHSNPLQEALQPEGDTNFAALLPKIEALIKAINVPVFVKEVGHGLDVRTAQKLVDMGVKGIDCAGVGGTSWAWVEAKRAENPEFEAWFKDYGLRTDDLLKEYKGLTSSVIKVVSGGLRSPIEAVKARTQGADFYSMAQPFLAPALESTDAVINVIKNFERGIKIVLFTSGCKSWAAAKNLIKD